MGASHQVDLYDVPNLQRMDNLELEEANIKDIILFEPHVQYLGKITSVDLRHNRLAAFGALGLLPQLKVLCLDHNKIRRLGLPRTATTTVERYHAPTDSAVVVASVPSIFPMLEVLHLAGNGIGDLQPLQLHRFPQLRSVRNEIMRGHNCTQPLSKSWGIGL